MDNLGGEEDEDKEDTPEEVGFFLDAKGEAEMVDIAEVLKNKFSALKFMPVSDDNKVNFERLFLNSGFKVTGMFVVHKYVMYHSINNAVVEKNNRSSTLHTGEFMKLEF